MRPWNNLQQEDIAVLLIRPADPTEDEILLGTDELPGCGALSDDLQRLTILRSRFGQRRDTFVQRDEHAAPTKGEPKQIRIRWPFMHLWLRCGARRP